MRMGVDVYLHAFLNSPAGRYDWSASRWGRFIFEYPPVFILLAPDRKIYIL